MSSTTDQKHVTLKLATVIALFCAFGGAVLSAAGVYYKLDQRLSVTESAVTSMSVQVEKLDEMDRKRDVQYAEIQKDLTYIRALLERGGGK
jgi:hypothetical protein